MRSRDQDPFLLRLVKACNHPGPELPMRKTFAQASDSSKAPSQFRRWRHRSNQLFLVVMCEGPQAPTESIRFPQPPPPQVVAAPTTEVDGEWATMEPASWTRGEWRRATHLRRPLESVAATARRPNSGRKQPCSPAQRHFPKGARGQPGSRARAPCHSFGAQLVRSRAQHHPSLDSPSAYPPRERKVTYWQSGPQQPRSTPCQCRSADLP